VRKSREWLASPNKGGVLHLKHIAHSFPVTEILLPFFASDPWVIRFSELLDQMTSANITARPTAHDRNADTSLIAGLLCQEQPLLSIVVAGTLALFI
jgi:hypothetical protein